MVMDPALEDRHTSPIRRITEDGFRWRVLVETWQESEAFHGRLLFRREVTDGVARDRETAPLLHGSSREDVLSLAYDFPEDRLRRVLYSLG
jgi:hypothetical protein